MLIKNTLKKERINTVTTKNIYLTLLIISHGACLFFLVAGEQLYIYRCPSVCQSVCQFVSGHNSASAEARKLKFGMKDACSRISGLFF